jgi:PhnB protein
MTAPKAAPTTALTPYLVCKDAARAGDFYVRVFDATESMRLAEPSGKVGHAELDVGGSTLMIADEYPDHGAVGPRTIGGTPVRVHLYVADVDAVVGRAVAAGATITRPVADQFYGDRAGTIEDPFGHLWNLATKKERLTPDEIQRRYAALTR